MDAARSKATLGDFEASPGSENDILLGYSHVGESKMHMAVRCVIHGENTHWPDNLYAWRVHRYEDLRVLLMAVIFRVCFNHTYQYLTAFISSA
jgi:hypothetical protein